MATPRLAIVADDLTGAADSAARATRAGLSAAILRDPTLWNDAPVTVAAVTTDSRHLAPVEAAQCVAQTVAALGAAGVWYKKIDSTLRGNIGAELAALLAALPDTNQAAVICPAFPAQGRGLADGALVHSGAATRPPHLPRLLEEQTDLPVAAIGLATVRGGAGKLANALQRARRNGARLLVVDALSDEDLVVVVTAGQQAGMLLCGSAGMVEPLAARLARTQAQSSVAGPEQIPAGPILTVVGSGSAMAHRQIATVAARGRARVRQVDGSWVSVDLIGSQTRPVGDWLIHLAAPKAGTPLEGPAARAAAANLADLAHGVTRRLQPGALILVGGDTAHFVLRSLGILRLDVLEELLPGMPLTLATDRTGARRAIVLKPGSFGDAQTLSVLLDELHRRMPAPETTAQD